MRVLVILNKGEAAGLRIIVKLHTKSLRNRVATLLKEDKKKEAIKLIVSKAMVESHLPPGTQPSVKPELTLVEDA